jgi:hypothetical protein
MRKLIRVSIFSYMLLPGCFATFAQVGIYSCPGAENYKVGVNDTGDCTGLLQRAIDSAAVTGNTICLQPGVYRTSGTIRLRAGVSLTGAGMGANANLAPDKGTIINYTGNLEAVIITGGNSSVKNLSIYNPSGMASAGIVLLADSQLVESVVLSGVLIFGFTGGTALLMDAVHHGGIAYCSFYDCRIRHARTGIHILESGPGSFVNSNSFFHGAISGGAFDNCILIDGGDNNVFYSTVIEPYTSVYGHLVVNKGQIIGENIRIEAARQAAVTPVINFGPGSALSRITGSFGGGVVINQGNNTISLATANYAGENTSGYNQFINSAFLLPAVNGIPAYWTVSNPNVRATITGDQIIAGESVLSIRVPPGSLCELYPESGYGPSLAGDPLYANGNFNVLAKTNKPAVLKLTYNYAGGLVSSIAHTGSGNWELIGLEAITNAALMPDPRIHLDNLRGTDTLEVSLTSPSFNFGTTLPQRDASVITAAGGIITGTLTTSVSNNYSFAPGTNYLVLPKNGNVFTLVGKNLTITRINYSIPDRFPPGTIIILLFNQAGSCIQNSTYVDLKSPFTTAAPNTSLTLLSKGDGTWREINRNN